MGSFSITQNTRALPAAWVAAIKTLAALSAVAAIMMWATGCKTASVTSESDPTGPPVPKPPVVYVADFELLAQDIKSEPGVLDSRPGPLGRIGQRLSGTSDPAARARQLVELMSTSLVKEVSKAGFNVERIARSGPFGNQGWLLRGVFTEVQEGNRLQRAMIGFGQGHTDIQVVANVQDLAKGPPKPIYEVATDANSGKTPGAAPTLVLGPYGAAARFVLAGGDLDKNVKQTAAKIAQRMATRTEK